ncbi:S8 family serine peptidase [Candidatus Solirubrobacter pratensis]|uniref:S8 family serine peptidase n=1 Tax=Candidatus Solirubrobacter pratensis TaxID=1298857 RepID=UPI0012DFAA76|nr:S8 family serine peptidase [Candidatus Solirubrobacter pratensis]
MLGSAGQGGAVIVWLNNDHTNLNLRRSAGARVAAAHNDQKPVVAAIRDNGGTGIVQLVSVNAVAAHVSAAGVDALRRLPAVKEIIPDATVPIGDPAPTGPQVKNAKIVPDATALRAKKGSKSATADPGANPFPTANNCGTIDNPLIEPEALQTINAPAMTNAGLATEPGHGVVVANDGISTAPRGDLVGNPNFVRPAADGGGSVVIGATPGDTTDSTDGEYYGDASSIDAQGTVLYQYSKELPYSGMPDTCYFKLVGDAPGASLVDTNSIDTPESAAGDRSVMSESELLAGIDAAVIKKHADVINESYGYSNSPGSYAIHYAANDAAVDAGVTVVASSGDSGVSGTVSSPASDPKIIAAGATNTHRLNAMAYGFAGWVNDDITPLSSGGTTPDNKLVDLVAPGYGGEAACNPHGSDCPTNTQTEAFGGTSESSPLIAGAAADVIQAYRDSHNGDSPSPALVKQLLVSTARDVYAPADQQGAGQVDIGAAVAAAQQTANTTVTSAPATNGLISTPTQLDLSGDGGSTSFQSVKLYNTSKSSTTVTGSYRELGPEHQIGQTVTENVSAPDPALPVPADGAQAAPDITFDVPAGLDRLDADMIWPDATNGTILSFILTDPTGRLRQISYDYGTASATAIGTVPNIGHVEVANPEAGTWRVQIKWANGRAHLQSLPNVPGTYTGPVSFKASGQNWITSPAAPTTTIAAHGSATIPLQVAFPNAPGDHPESVQFTAANGATTSLPIARRTLVPSTGGEFDTQITSTVGRGIGQISTFNVNVPAGRSDLGVTVTTPDTSTDDPMTLYLVNPAGTSVATHTTTTGSPPRTRTVNGVLLTTQTVNGTPMQTATFHVANPMAGTWEIDVALNLTSSGKEFTQTVVGDVLPQAPTITSPAGGATLTSTTPLISGTGVAGDTVTVSNGSTVVCTATVGKDGTWSCTPSPALPGGSAALTATQADQTGKASAASAPVAITVPLGSTSSTTTVSATTPATLALSLGAPASFGALTPGIDKTYTAATTADVVSSAADATLSVATPGHLTNGAFSLPEPLQVSLSKSSWSGPVSNDAVTVGLTQHVGANDALRTGSYSQTLTFTLSTIQP